MSSKLMVMAVMLSAVLALSACSDNSEQASNQTSNIELQPEAAELKDEYSGKVTPAQLNELAGEIFRLVGTPEADNPEQCQALPFGAKPCGGPASWLVYSTKVTDSDALAEKVEHYNMLSERYNEQEELVSDCAVVNPVVTNIMNGICVASEQVTM